MGSFLALWRIVSKLLWLNVGGAVMGSRRRFTFVRIVACMHWSSGAVRMVIWSTSPLLVGVQVTVRRSSGTSYRSIGFPVWMLRKMWRARERMTSYRSLGLGLLELTGSGGVVSFQMT